MQFQLFCERFKLALLGFVIMALGLAAAIFISSIFMTVMFIGVSLIWIGGFIGFLRIIAKRDSNTDIDIRR